MAHVSRGSSTLPGSSHSVPHGMMCDDHPERPAVARIQGETDSFGAEFVDLCQGCLDAYRQHKAENGVFRGFCSSCKSDNVPLFPWRDYEEGSCGPVYYKCRPCIRYFNELQYKELEESGSYRNDDDFWYEADGDDGPNPEPESVIASWGIRFKGTDQFVCHRHTPGLAVRFDCRRDADKFMRRHRGKLRGRALVVHHFWV